ncbi:MAG: helix-turn-helix domain-containing protein [Acidimicrobiales bacterium]
MSIEPTSFEDAPADLAQALLVVAEVFADAVVARIGVRAHSAPEPTDMRTARAEKSCLLSVQDVAERLAIGKTTVYKIIADGRLRSVRIDRARRVPEEALAEFVSGAGQVRAPMNDDVTHLHHHKRPA